MGKIMHANVPYSGSNNEIVYLTQAEYDALTPAQKTNGKSYFVTNSTDSAVSASNVPYSNTTSGLISTNVQGAIDEVNDKTQHYTKLYTIPAGSTAMNYQNYYYQIWTKLQEIANSVPTGKYIRFTSVAGLAILYNNVYKKSASTIVNISSISQTISGTGVILINSVFNGALANNHRIQLGFSSTGTSFTNQDSNQAIAAGSSVNIVISYDVFDSEENF